MKIALLQLAIDLVLVTSRELTFSVCNTTSGQAVCATDSPASTVQLNSGSTDCSVNTALCAFKCQKDLNCVEFNYRSTTQMCDLFYSLPSSYQTQSGCSYFQKKDSLTCAMPGLNPCINGGTCIPACNNYVCNCLVGYVGRNCEYLIIQRRTDGSVNFYLNWASYKNGFGDKSNEFWLGLDRVYQLTSTGNYKLRIELGDFRGNHSYAEYSTFTIGSEASGYVLHVGGYSGTAGDCLAAAADKGLLPISNGQKFTTYDKDNDGFLLGNCAVMYKGAWWYNFCHVSNLNGAYLRGAHTTNADGVEWYCWTGYQYSLKFTQMMIMKI